MESGNRKTNLILTMKPERLGDFYLLLQQGVTVEAHVGCTLDRLLNRQWEIPEDYALQRITTIFLNSRPIDDLASASIREDDVIALSGAMPGLVGATMRRGGFYAAMREGITYHDNAIDISDRVATVRVKLFNLLLPELGPGFLYRGINISATELYEFMKGRTDSFWQGCNSAFLDNHPVSPLALQSEDLFLPGSIVRLSINFSSPQTSTP